MRKRRYLSLFLAAVMAFGALSGAEPGVAQGEGSPWPESLVAQGNVPALPNAGPSNPTLAWVREYPDLHQAPYGAIALADAGLLLHARTRDGDDEEWKRLFVALNADDGSIRWIYERAADFDNICLAAIDAAGRIWTLENSRLFALDPADGLPIASTILESPETQGSICQSVFRVFGSTLVHYDTGNGSFHAFDIGTTPPQHLWTREYAPTFWRRDDQPDPSEYETTGRLPRMSAAVVGVDVNATVALDKKRDLLLVPVEKWADRNDERHYEYLLQRVELSTGQVLDEVVVGRYSRSLDSPEPPCGVLRDCDFSAVEDVDVRATSGDYASVTDIGTSSGDDYTPVLVKLDTQPLSLDGRRGTLFYDHTLYAHYATRTLRRLADDVVVARLRVPDMGFLRLQPQSDFSDAELNSYLSGPYSDSLGLGGRSFAADGRTRWERPEIPPLRPGCPDSPARLPMGPVASDGSLYVIGTCFDAARWPHPLLVAKYVDATAPTVGRLAGASRFETAVELSGYQFPGGAEVVYLARADDFPDGLAGGSLAGGPLLLVPSCGSLPEVVRAEVDRLQAERVVALGGPDAVCDEMLQAAAAGRHPARLAGPTRFDTAVEISRHQFPEGAEVAYLARADEFPDALAGGSLTGGPLLLVPSCGSLPEVVRAEVDRLQAERVVALGGPDAVCDEMLQAAAAGRHRARLAGPTRFDTAIEISRHQFPEGAEVAYLARADEFPDALAGGPLTGGPLLLVPSCGPLPEVVQDELHRLGLRQIRVLGGEEAVCNQTLETISTG